MVSFDSHPLRRAQWSRNHSKAVKAVQITAPQRAEIIEVPEPAIPEGRSGMVKVRLERACLCGSDRPLWHLDFRHAHPHQLIQHYDVPVPDNPGEIYPLLPGLSIHECVGTVEESTSERFRAGDFVLALPYIHHGFFEVLCLDEARIFPLPPGGAAKEEILMSQPLGTILRAFDRMPAFVGRSVAVVGQGPIGLMMTQLLRNLGAARVITIEPLAYRRDLAEKMGATATVDPTAGDIAEAVRAANEGALADVSIEAVGHDEYAIGAAVAAVRTNGRLVQFGVLDEPFPKDYPANDILWKNLTVHNSIGACEAVYFELARNLIASGRFDVQPIVTHQLPLEQAQRAYEIFIRREENCAKVVIDFEK